MWTRSCIQQHLGMNMVLFSPIVIGLGIANVVLTQGLCAPTGCSPITNTLALTWVAVAIWAPIPIFFNGIGAIWLSKRPAANTNWLCFLSAVNSFTTGPLIFIVTASEAANKLAAAGVAVSSLTGTPQALYGIEVTIAIIGAVLWLHALAIFYLNNCCCHLSCAQDASDDEQNDDNFNDNEAYAYNRRQPRRQPQDDKDVDRLNLWSAYRFMNNNGGYGGGDGGYNGGYGGRNGGFSGGYYGGNSGFTARPVAPPAARGDFYANGAYPAYSATGGYGDRAGIYPLGPRGMYVGALNPLSTKKAWQDPAKDKGDKKKDKKGGETAAVAPIFKSTSYLVGLSNGDNELFQVGDGFCFNYCSPPK